MARTKQRGYWARRAEEDAAKEGEDISHLTKAEKAHRAQEKERKNREKYDAESRKEYKKKVREAKVQTKEHLSRQQEPKTRQRFTAPVLNSKATGDTAKVAPSLNPKVTADAANVGTSLNSKVKGDAAKVKISYENLEVLKMELKSVARDLQQILEKLDAATADNQDGFAAGNAPSDNHEDAEMASSSSSSSSSDDDLWWVLKWLSLDSSH